MCIRDSSNLGITLNALGSRESALKHFERSLQLTRGINPVDFYHKSLRHISIAKLDHDIEQFRYIAASGIGIKKFQELSQKELIIICDVGAYGMSLSSNYNVRAKPAELLVKNSKIQVITKRQSLKDLI